MASPASNSPVNEPLLLQLLEDPADLGRQPLDLLRQLLGHRLALGLLRRPCRATARSRRPGRRGARSARAALQTAVAGAQTLGRGSGRPRSRVRASPPRGRRCHALTRRGQRYSLAHRSFSRKTARSSRYLGQGGGLALSLLSHTQGDYSLRDPRRPISRKMEPRRSVADQAPQHFLYFLPLPHGQGSLRPTLLMTVLGATTVLVAACAAS